MQFISDDEIRTLLAADESSMQKELYNAIKRRVLKHTLLPSFVQEGDTQEWYHLCLERASDAALVYRTEGGEALGAWIHDRAMEIAAMESDGWVGPFYRPRTPKQLGMLETAHIARALCELYVNCPACFDDAEKEVIQKALRETAMVLCRRFCEDIIEKRIYISNWFMVLLDGYGTCAVTLGDEGEIEKAIEFSHIAARAYNSDSYGESVQYSNYASMALAHLNEVLLRYGVDASRLETACYENLMPWYAASYLYTKSIPSLGVAPRAFNFGDSAAAFRPSGDLLMEVAVRGKGDNARLAKWLFDINYSAPDALPDECASFGMINHFSSYSCIMYNRAAKAASPAELQLPTNMSFEVGHIIMRDKWDNPSAQLAIGGGYKKCNASTHRHADQNSFQLSVRNERFLIDPGHCCYRLLSQKRSVSEELHNVILLYRGGEKVPQKIVEGNIFNPKEPMNTVLCNTAVGDTQIIISDGAKLYEGVTKAVRMFVVNLPHMIFVIDYVTANTPTAVSANFVLNNRDGKLKTHIYNPQRLIFRRGEGALKLIELLCETDGKADGNTLSFDYGYVHDYYHPLPNSAGQGKEGSALCFRRTADTEGYSHLRIHGLAFDKEEYIKGWHLTNDGSLLTIEPPSKQGSLSLRANGSSICVITPDGQEKTFDL